MDRFAKGQKAVNELKGIFKSMNIKYEDIGRECVIQDKDLKRKLNKDDSLTSCFIRFQPDLFVFRDEPYLIEVKCSKTITKQAYHHYLRLEFIGYNILIFFLIHGTWYYSKPSEIEFFSYPSENGLMPHKKFDFKIPVAGHWVHPRRMEKKDYYIYKSKTGGSGTPYAAIDFTKMKKL